MSQCQRIISDEWKSSKDSNKFDVGGARVENLGMKRVRTGDEHDVIAGLELVVELTLELPVGIVDEHEDSRANRLALHKEVRAALVREVVVEQVPDEPAYVRRGRDREPY